MMTEIEDIMVYVVPREVLSKLSDAIPPECKKNMIIIGSLAAGFQYENIITGMGIRTKDADCLLSPRMEALDAGRMITEKLLDTGWTIQKNGDWNEPGTQSDPDDELPVVRLYPPRESEWFIELLSVPESPSEREKKWARLETKYGHFGLPSFGYLSLTSFRPTPTKFGISIARSEMMALANMLEHPEIDQKRISGNIAGRFIKRSNKDLGRVLSLAHLASMEDEDALLEWPSLWVEGLKDRFPEDWPDIGSTAGSGIRELLSEVNESDLEDAHWSCVYGFLASIPISINQLRIIGERLIVDAVEPFEEQARSSR